MNKTIKSDLHDLAVIWLKSILKLHFKPYMTHNSFEPYKTHIYNKNNTRIKYSSLFTIFTIFLHNFIRTRVSQGTQHVHRYRILYIQCVTCVFSLQDD